MPPTFRRRALRRKLSSRFAAGRNVARPQQYDATFDQSTAIMQNADLFDFDKLPKKDIARYGKKPFGRDTLMARRLLEAGVTFVMVRHTDYDSHSENFNGHLEQLGEWDQPFATFVNDLSDRGMLEHTLIIVMCEFGRTPKINRRVGRDHWGTAWSVALGGCGIKAGAVVGKTNKNGTKSDRPRSERRASVPHVLQSRWPRPDRRFYPQRPPVPQSGPEGERNPRDSRITLSHVRSSDRQSERSL